MFCLSFKSGKLPQRQNSHSDSQLQSLASDPYPLFQTHISSTSFQGHTLEARGPKVKDTQGQSQGQTSSSHRLLSQQSQGNSDTSQLGTTTLSGAFYGSAVINDARAAVINDARTAVINDGSVKPSNLVYNPATGMYHQISPNSTVSNTNFAQGGGVNLLKQQRPTSPGHYYTTQFHGGQTSGSQHIVNPLGTGIPVQGHAVPIQGHSVPLQGHSVPFQGHSVPIQGHSVPFQGSVPIQNIPLQVGGPHKSPLSPNQVPMGMHQIPSAVWQQVAMPQVQGQGQGLPDNQPIQPTDPRFRLYYHLCGIFAEPKVRTVMNRFPQETDPQKLYKAIMNV